MINIDKLYHFLAGFIVSVTSLVLFDQTVAVIAVIAIAAAKEVYDSKHPAEHTADGSDFIATVVGGLTGLNLGF